MIKAVVAIILLITTYNNVLSQISPNRDRMHDAVKYLADDKLKGRFPGTEGIEMAAVYIEEQFKLLGLKKFGDSYRQEFSVATSYSYDASSTVSLETVVQRPGVPVNRLPKVKQNWEISNDFVPLGFSDNGAASGEIAFVGFGISAPELKYDDYEGIDVKDKIVIFISENPDKDKKDSPFLPYSSLRYKASNARNKGAKGIIMVRIQGDSMNVFERPEYQNRGKNSGIIAIQAWRQSLSKFFPKNKTLIFLENEIVKNKQPMSFILPNVTSYLKVELIDNESQTYNINAYVEGSDPVLKNEYILIGAHYDHLGYGGPTSMASSLGKPQIHNGADDNASGVAAIVEIAHKIAESPLKRSVIFSSFSSEEIGLFGSSYFVNNPPVSLDKIVAMINLDMVGRMRDNELTAFGASTGDVFSEVIDSLDLVDTLQIIKVNDAYGPSDHASFVVKNIPVVMFFTGIHEDYHKPSDDTEKINFGGMVWAVNFVYNFVETIGNKSVKPTFVKSVNAVPERKKDKESGQSDVWFGIIPNFEENPLGCIIAGSTPGSPADKAGLVAKDIIVKIDDTEIKNLYDFMYKIRAHKAGDVLNVHILRGEDHTQKVELKVTLMSKIK